MAPFKSQHASYPAVAPGVLLAPTLAADARLPGGRLEMPPQEVSSQSSWPSPCQPRTLAADARLPDGNLEMLRKKMSSHRSRPSPCQPRTLAANTRLQDGILRCCHKCCCVKVHGQVHVSLDFSSKRTTSRWPICDAATRGVAPELWPSPCQLPCLAADARLPGGHFQML